jgi:hypothetical protein
MTQTLEPGIKREHSKGKRTGGHGARTTNAEHRSLGIGVPASRSATAPQPNARWDELWMQQIAGATTALLFAALAPALVMAALWHTAEVAPNRICLHVRHRARSRGFARSAAFSGVSVKGVDQRHHVRRPWVRGRCRAGCRHDLADAPSRASHERIRR